MRDILDLAARWTGTPGGTLVSGDKAPVAVPDSLTVAMDSGAVSVQVLANDYDPEGGVLTLISATAALGTAVAETDGTVTYTPPSGISGFDTVVYEIADPLDQRRSGQVDVTITDPQLSVDVTAENTLIVTASGTIDVTVSSPASFAGTYVVDTVDLASGPVNLVAADVTGTAGEGDVLSAVNGLWIYDLAAGVPTRDWQWHRDGVEIAGATARDYTVVAADAGTTLTPVETLSDAHGQRSAAGVSVTASGQAPLFDPSQDTGLLGWWDASDAATITETGGLVSGWADKAGGSVLQPQGGTDPRTGSRTLNGLNVLDFDGSAYLEAARTLPASGDVAFHMALIIDGSSNDYEAVLSFEATNDMQIDARSSTQFDGRLNVAGIGNSADFSGGPFSGPVILSAIFDRTGTAMIEVFLGGVSRAQTGYTSALDSATALHLMSNRARNAFGHGAVGELILTGATDNRQTYHDYLAAKWGLS